MPEKNYRVDTKEEIRRLDKAGNLETVYRIWATTKKGTYFHIDVAEDQIAKADAALAARATELDAI